jgi:hypothetical protein
MYTNVGALSSAPKYYAVMVSVWLLQNLAIVYDNPKWQSVGSIILQNYSGKTKRTPIQSNCTIMGIIFYISNNFKRLRFCGRTGSYHSGQSRCTVFAKGSLQMIRGKKVKSDLRV